MRQMSSAWMMGTVSGRLFGNGKCGDDHAGAIDPGQLVTMEVDLNAGTLRFWVDGKPHGPGWTSGVAGPLRWAVHLHGRPGVAGSVEIWPTTCGSDSSGCSDSSGSSDSSGISNSSGSSGSSDSSGSSGSDSNSEQ